MDKITELKQAIFDGFKIYGIKLRDIGNKFEATATCINDSTNEVLRISSADDEYLRFVLFFRKYWSQGKNLIESHLNNYYLSPKAKVVIAEKQFEKIFLLHSIKSQPQNSEGTASFIVDLSDHYEFSAVDFKDPIEIFDSSGKLVFSGFIRKSQSQNNLCFIFCQDLSIKMREYKMNAEFLNGNPAEIIAFIFHSGELGLGINFHESIEYDESEREFLVICPILGIKTSVPFDIGEVKFYPSESMSEDVILDETIISNTEHYEEHQSLWNSDVTRAKIIVKAKHLYEAMQIGNNLISRAIDIISLRVCFTQQSVVIAEKNHNFDYDHEQKAIRVNMSDWIYARDLASPNNAAALLNHKRLYDESIILNKDPKTVFNGIDVVFNGVVVQGTIPKYERNIISSLHWLRRANQAQEVSDKIIDMWNAAEFSVSNFKPKAVFSDSEHQMIKETIENIDYLNQSQKNILMGKLGRLNDPSLRQKVSLQPPSQNANLGLI